MKKYILSATLIISLFTSCQKVLLGTAASNTPINNFESMWKGYNEYYGLFGVNPLNWDSLHIVYKSRINNNMTNQQLDGIMKEMVGNFNNIHVFIQPTSDGLPRYESSNFYVTHKIQEDFSLSTVKHYIPTLDSINAAFHFGITSDNIGYIHFASFDLPVGFYSNQMGKVMNKMKDTKGIIIDIRNHGGGDDKVSKYISGWFAAEEKLFMTERKKKGPAHNDFTDPQKWIVTKEGDYQYTKPVALLTTRWSASAAETFTWAMRTQPHVKQIGDTTAGGFSDVLSKELPNGWIYFVPVGDFRNANGESMEGKGIAPDFVILNKKEELKNGVDRVLEKAIMLLW